MTAPRPPESRAARAYAPGVAIVAACLAAGLLAGVLLAVASRSGRPDAMTVVGTSSPSRAARSATPTTAPTRFSPSPAPSAQSTPRATASRSSTAGASPTTGARFSVAGANPADAAAIVAAVDRLGSLDAYRFETAASGRHIHALREDRLIDFRTHGMLSQEEELDFDLTVAFQVIEPSGEAATSAQRRTVVIGDRAWTARGDASPSPDPISDETLTGLRNLLPESIARWVVVPFAEAYKRSTQEELDGAAVARYDLFPAGARLLESSIAIDGSCESAIWIAEDGGHLARARTQCTAEDDTRDRGFFLEIRVTDPNDPEIEIRPPS